jgi:hypothetical protein
MVVVSTNVDSTKLHKSNEKPLLDVYSHLLSPLFKLDGLHQLFVHFDFPYPCTAPEAPLETPKYGI